MTAVTCYVFDVHTGAPASGMPVALRCLSHYTRFSQSKILPVFGGCHWNLTPFLESLSPNTDTVWQIDFDIGAYYGQTKTPWPGVNVCFYLKKAEGYMITLNIGPESYTTNGRLLPSGSHQPPNNLKSAFMTSVTGFLKTQSSNHPHPTSLETHPKASIEAKPDPVEPWTFGLRTQPVSQPSVLIENQIKRSQGFKAHGTWQEIETGTAICLPHLENLGKLPYPASNAPRLLENTARIPPQVAHQNANGLKQLQSSSGTQATRQGTIPQPKMWTLHEPEEGQGRRLPNANLDIQQWLQQVIPSGKAEQQGKELESQTIHHTNTLLRNDNPPPITCEPCRRARRFCPGGNPCGRCLWSMYKCYYTKCSIPGQSNMAYVPRAPKEVAHGRVSSAREQDHKAHRPVLKVDIPYREEEHVNVVNSTLTTNGDHEGSNEKKLSRPQIYTQNSRCKKQDFVRNHSLKHSKTQESPTSVEQTPQSRGGYQTFEADSTMDLSNARKVLVKESMEVDKLDPATTLAEAKFFGFKRRRWA